MSAQPVTAARRWFTDPLVPLVALASAGLAVVLAAPSLATWAVLGGLAGYTLSGSV